jgi:hypothetical protein
MSKRIPAGTERVSVTVVAHLQAGLAEEHSLDALLALEDLTPAAFRYGETQLKQRFVTEALVRAEYEEALVAAEDRFHRAVAPVDTDPTAWVALLDAYAFAPAPFAFLTRLGLRLTDMSRLRRTWAKRVLATPGLDDELAAARRARPSLPALQIGPTPLVSSKGVPPDQPRPVAALDAVKDGLAAIESFGLDRLAALGAELQQHPERGQETLGKYGIGRAEHASLVASLTAALSSSPRVSSDYAHLLQHHAQRLKVAQRYSTASAQQLHASPGLPPVGAGESANAIANAPDAHQVADAVANAPAPPMRSRAPRTIALTAGQLGFTPEQPTIGLAPLPTVVVDNDEATVPPNLQDVDSLTLPFVPFVRPVLPEPTSARPGDGSDGDTALPVLGGQPRVIPFEPGFEDYARLRAALAKHPEDAGPILRLFGLDAPGELERVQETWHRRFSDDPNLRDRWLALFTSLRAGG